MDQVNFKRIKNSLFSAPVYVLCLQTDSLYYKGTCYYLQGGSSLDSWPFAYDIKGSRNELLKYLLHGVSLDSYMADQSFGCYLSCGNCTLHFRKTDLKIQIIRGRIIKLDMLLNNSDDLRVK